jgi:hypothetical protein
VVVSRNVRFARQEALVLRCLGAKVRGAIKGADQMALVAIYKPYRRTQGMATASTSTNDRSVMLSYQHRAPSIRLLALLAVVAGQEQHRRSDLAIPADAFPAPAPKAYGTCTDRIAHHRSSAALSAYGDRISAPERKRATLRQVRRQHGMAAVSSGSEDGNGRTPLRVRDMRRHGDRHTTGEAGSRSRHVVGCPSAN